MCGGKFDLPFFMVRAVGAVLLGRSAHTRTDPPKADTELPVVQAVTCDTNKASRAIVCSMVNVVVVVRDSLFRKKKW